MKLDDYILDTAGVSWPTTLSTWRWLIPSVLTVWFTNRFGDVFLALEDKSINRLNLDGGTLDRLAESREEFETKIDEDQNYNDWLLIPLVDRLVAAGVILPVGKCYAFTQLPILGGSYDVGNVATVGISERIAFLGDVYRQIADLPDGTKVKFNGSNIAQPADTAQRL